MFGNQNHFLCLRKVNVKNYVTIRNKRQFIFRFYVCGSWEIFERVEHFEVKFRVILSEVYNNI